MVKLSWVDVRIVCDDRKGVFEYLTSAEKYVFEENEDHLAHPLLLWRTLAY